MSVVQKKAYQPLPGRSPPANKDQELAVISLPASSPDELEVAYRDWLRAISRGDEAALKRLYEATESRVFGLALRITCRAAAAEEVTEDVYIQLWRQADRYDPVRGKVLTWLLTICRSRALDYLRTCEKADLHPEPETLAPDRFVVENDPQDLLLAVERNHAVYAALSELTPLQRQLLTLAFFKGYTHEEIAAHCQLPLGSVKSHIRRALQMLKQKVLDVRSSSGKPK